MSATSTKLAAVRALQSVLAWAQKQLDEASGSLQQGPAATTMVAASAPPAAQAGALLLPYRVCTITPACNPLEALFPEAGGPQQEALDAAAAPTGPAADAQLPDCSCPPAESADARRDSPGHVVPALLPQLLGMPAATTSHEAVAALVTYVTAANSPSTACVCARACARACVCVCARVCVSAEVPARLRTQGSGCMPSPSRTTKQRT